MKYIDINFIVIITMSKQPLWSVRVSGSVTLVTDMKLEKSPQLTVVSHFSHESDYLLLF